MKGSSSDPNWPSLAFGRGTTAWRLMITRPRKPNSWCEVPHPIHPSQPNKLKLKMKKPVLIHPLSNEKQSPLCLAGKLSAVLVLSWLVAGCASMSPVIRPISVGPPPPGPPAVLVLGDLRFADDQMANPNRQLLLHAFQLGVEQWCVASHSFQVRTDTTSSNAPGDAMVLTGTLTEHVAMLSPADTTISGQFVIRSPDGTQLALFVAHTEPSQNSEDYKAMWLGSVVAEFIDRWAWSEKSP